MHPAWRKWINMLSPPLYPPPSPLYLYVCFQGACYSDSGLKMMPITGGVKGQWLLNLLCPLVNLHCSMPPVGWGVCNLTLCSLCTPQIVADVQPFSAWHGVHSHVTGFISCWNVLPPASM